MRGDWGNGEWEWGMGNREWGIGNGEWETVYPTCSAK